MTPRILTALLFLVVATAHAQAPKKTPPRTVAPESIPHGTALFLAGLSDGGEKRVTFKAAAVGTRFFFEEPTGVSVYVYGGNGYRRETFLKGQTLERVMQRYRVVATK